MGQGQGSNLGAFPVSYVANLFHFVSPLKASYRHKIPDLSRSPPSFFLTLSHHELLLESSLAVGEIAARVGYASQSAFTAALVREFGVTPRQLRRESRDKTG